MTTATRSLVVLTTTPDYASRADLAAAIPALAARGIDAEIMDGGGVDVVIAVAEADQVLFVGEPAAYVADLAERFGVPVADLAEAMK